MILTHTHNQQVAVMHIMLYVNRLKSQEEERSSSKEEDKVSYVSYIIHMILCNFVGVIPTPLLTVFCFSFYLFNLTNTLLHIHI